MLQARKAKHAAEKKKQAQQQSWGKRKSTAGQQPLGTTESSYTSSSSSGTGTATSNESTSQTPTKKQKKSKGTKAVTK